MSLDCERMNGQEEQAVSMQKGCIFTKISMLLGMVLIVGLPCGRHLCCDIFNEPSIVSHLLFFIVQLSHYLFIIKPFSLSQTVVKTTSHTGSNAQIIFYDVTYYKCIVALLPSKKLF